MFMMYTRFLSNEKLWVVVNENGVILTYQKSYIDCVNWINSHK